MEFTECVKDRLTLTLKSGLLCAVMLMPATALAQSPEIVRGDAVTSTRHRATAVEAGQTPSAPNRQLPPSPPSNGKSPVLSGHIQSKYRVPEAQGHGTSCMKPSATASATRWTRN